VGAVVGICISHTEGREEKVKLSAGQLCSQYHYHQAWYPFTTSSIITTSCTSPPPPSPPYHGRRSCGQPRGNGGWDGSGHFQN